MGKHDEITRGMGLHGQAVVAMIRMLSDQGRRDPHLHQIARLIGTSESELRRIFGDDQGLLTAVAEQALIRLLDSCAKALVQADPEDPVGQMLAMGVAYVQWAADHPLQFRVISSHPTLDVLQVPELRRYLDSLDNLAIRMLERAQEAGRLAPDEDLAVILLSSRSFAYGVARMVVDGRMEGLRPAADPIAVAELMLSEFLRRLAPRAASRPGRGPA